MNNLAKRTLTGALYVVLTVVILLFGGNILAVCYLFLIALLCYIEFLKINLKITSLTEIILPVLVASFVFMLVYLNQDPEVVNTGKFTYFLMSTLVLPLLPQLFSRRDDPVHYLGVVYLGYFLTIVPFALLGQVANLPYPGSGHELMPYTPLTVLMVFIFLWVSDTFAYVGGKLTGKTKLAPRISPGKTVEGFISGWFITNVSVFIAAPFCSPYLSLVNLVILANICVIFGLAGDLIISRFKRSLGLKDSGNILPGHGGFLDRFDSLLIAAPAVFFYLKSFLLFKHMI